MYARTMALVTCYSQRMKRSGPLKPPMPDRMPDTPGNILATVLAGPHRKDWDYLRKSGGKPRSGT